MYIFGLGYISRNLKFHPPDAHCSDITEQNVEKHHANLQSNIVCMSHVNAIWHTAIDGFEIDLSLMMKYTFENDAPYIDKDIKSYWNMSPYVL